MNSDARDVLGNVRDALPIRKGRIVTIMTPSGPLAVMRPVAEQLLANGVITGHLQGELRATDAATVKAAMMAGAGICDFCAAPGAANVFDVPDFAMPSGLGISTEGWAACDTCAELVRAENRKALLDRSTAGLAFPKFSKNAIAELHARFWRALEDRDHVAGIGLAITDYVEGRLQHLVTIGPNPREIRVAAVCRMTGLTGDQVEAVLRGKPDADAFEKMAKFQRRFGTVSDPRATIQRFVDAPPHMAHGQVPHWQRALDMRFDALTQLDKAMKAVRQSVYTPDAVDLNDRNAVKQVVEAAQARINFQSMGFNDDARWLRAAQAYSFNAETTAAIRQAAESLPHDAPLSSVQLPSAGAGWFWFAEPFALATAPQASQTTAALLWGWERERTEPSMGFSCYVMAEHGIESGHMFPSVRWRWPANMSFHDLLAFTTSEYREHYGPGGKFEHAREAIGETATIEQVAEFSLFFLMACLWFRQEVPILEQQPGHVERHARKRYQREHKLAEPPTVKVIALRKSMRSPAPPQEGEATHGAREYTCRWIVSGHARLQACGPGRKDRKLIWVNPYPKGPEDKPLRTREKVYAVVR